MFHVKSQLVIFTVYCAIRVFHRAERRVRRCQMLVSKLRSFFTSIRRLWPYFVNNLYFQMCVYTLKYFITLVRFITYPCKDFIDVIPRQFIYGVPQWDCRAVLGAKRSHWSKILY